MPPGRQKGKASLERTTPIIRFGNDGWHARFDEGFDSRNVIRVADALGLLWADAAPDSSGSVYVGFDTRHRSEEFAREAAGAIASYGLVVKVSSSPCPTPVVGWNCAHDPKALGGVVITSSERSCEYGGLIVRGSDGGTCPREFLDKVEQEIFQQASTEAGPFEVADLTSPYVRALAEFVGGPAIRPLKVVVDPMYGSATGVLADLVRSLGHEVIEIHAEKLEDFDGIHPDPKDPWADACEQEVVAAGADLGILVDGDGDRAAAVDEYGNILAVRELTPLLLSYIGGELGMRGRVVTTLTCSASVELEAQKLGFEYTSVPVGFGRIYRELQEGDVLLGAEEYGGISIPAHLKERDGLLVSLLLVQMVSKSGLTLRELVNKLDAEIGSRRYIRRDVRLEPALTQAFRNVLPGLNPQEIAGRVPVEVSHADGLRLKFDDDSWVLMCPSRTDSVVRVYAEAPTARERDELLESACSIARGGF